MQWTPEKSSDGEIKEMMKKYERNKKEIAESDERFWVQQKKMQWTPEWSSDGEIGQR